MKLFVSFSTCTAFIPQLHLFLNIIFPSPHMCRKTQPPPLFSSVSSFHSHKMSSPFFTKSARDKSDLHFPLTNFSYDFRQAHVGYAVASRHESLCKASIIVFITLTDSTEFPYTTYTSQAEIQPEKLPQHNALDLSIP